MKVLALDISTKTGWSYFESADSFPLYGTLHVKVEDFNVNDHPELSPKYPFNIVIAADEMARQILDLYIKFLPDIVIIENTVKGRNRHTQRILEFLHKAVLDRFKDMRMKLKYIDPSRWRSVLEIRLSNDDKINNKLVNQGKKRGKITKKHLSVRAVNSLYNLKLKLKDNDIADSICLGRAFYEMQ